MKPKRLVTLDIETQGLRIFDKDTAATSINWKSRGKYHFAKPNDLEAKALLKELNDPSVIIGAWKAPFDLCGLCELDPEWKKAVEALPANRIFDGLAFYHMLAPTQIHSLIAATRNILQEPVNDKLVNHDYRKGPPALPYMRFDLEKTDKLVEGARQALENLPQQRKVYESMVEPIIPITVLMRNRGLSYSQDAGNRLRASLKKQAKKELAQLRRLGLPETLKSTQKQKIAIWVSETFGKECLPKTAGGAPSLDAIKVAKRWRFIVEDFPGAAVFLEWQQKASKTDKLLSFIDSYEKAAGASRDGRIHPGWNPSGPITDRFSSSPDSLMQIPMREEKHGPEFRNLFYPREGFLASVDYSGIEMRVFAHYVGDKKTLDAVMSGDIHSKNAEMIFTKIPPAFAKAMRDIAKMGNFQRIYGSGQRQAAAAIRAKTMAAGIPESLLAPPERAWAQWGEYLPAAEGFMRGIIEHVRNFGGITNVFGRFIPISPREAYTGVDLLVQSTVSALIRMAMPKIEAAGIPIVMQMHDELFSGEFRQKKEAEEAARKMRRLMVEDAHMFKVPIDTDHKILTAG